MPASDVINRFKGVLRRGVPSYGRRDGDVAPPIHSDDLFLVSYPKSGNTWMRFLLANLLRVPSSGRDADPIDFNTTVRYVPEYELHFKESSDAPRPRILKSHAPYNPAFPRVVYLMRDPRDVYVSYFHYMRKRLPEGVTLREFIRLEELHPCHWHEHVSGWVDRPGVLTIRYEDMLSDTHSQLRRCIEFWGGRTFSDRQISEAVNASSFERMKQIEHERGRPFQSEEHARRSTPFMRKGKCGDWVNHLAPDDLAYLGERCGVLMDRFGYVTEGGRLRAG